MSSKQRAWKNGYDICLEYIKLILPSWIEQNKTTRLITYHSNDGFIINGIKSDGNILEIVSLNIVPVLHNYVLGDI